MFLSSFTEDLQVTSKARDALDRVLGREPEGDRADGTTISTDLRPLFDAYNVILGGGGMELRPSQLQFMVTCYEAAANALPAVVEGPTGLGKTKALLAVASAYISTRPGARVLYATRTMPQLQNVQEDLYQITTGSLRNQAGEGSGLASYSVYIGTGSVRRLLCQRHVDGITMDEEELDRLRRASDDPERWESCPDCGIRDTRRRWIPDGELGASARCGLEDMARCLEERRCPLPLMRAAARKASLVLTTYPYLLNDFWKASVLGPAKTRADCLPIVDEAHNVIEMVTKSPALTLHLTDELAPGQGLDLTGNQYYLASLVEDLKYGYKRVVLGYLGSLFDKDKGDRFADVRERIREVDGLRTRRKELQVEARQVREAFNDFVKALPKVREGEDPGLPSDSPWQEAVQQARKLFQAAVSLLERNREVMQDHKAACLEHRNTCARAKSLRQERDELQAEAKRLALQRNVSFGTSRQAYHDAAISKRAEAQMAYESMVALSQTIDAMSKKIDRLQEAVRRGRDEQSVAYDRAQQTVQALFDDRQRDDQERRRMIDEVSSQITAMQAEID